MPFRLVGHTKMTGPSPPTLVLIATWTLPWLFVRLSGVFPRTRQLRLVVMDPYVKAGENIGVLHHICDDQSIVADTRPTRARSGGEIPPVAAGKMVRPFPDAIPKE
jgi:hypothetical protein